MASGRLIDYLGEGLFSARPVTPDLAAGALGLYYATDTEVLYAWDGSAWDTITGGGGSGAPITATTGETGTTLTATGANAWNYTRFTNAGTKTYTFDSAETYTNNAEYHGRNVGAGDLTIAEAGSFVITPPVGGSLVIPSGQSFFLKITGTNTADLILQSPSGTGPPPPGTPPVVRSVENGTTASGLLTTLPIPAAAVAGDLVVICYAFNSTAGAITPSITGWTYEGSGDNYYGTLTRVLTGSDTAPSFTTASTKTCQYSSVAVETGTFDASDPYDLTVLTGSLALNQAINVPSLTWNSASVLWIGLATASSTARSWLNMPTVPFDTLNISSGGFLSASGAFDYTQLPATLRMGPDSITSSKTVTLIGVNPI